MKKTFFAIALSALFSAIVLLFAACSMAADSDSEDSIWPEDGYAPAAMGVSTWKVLWLIVPQLKHESLPTVNTLSNHAVWLTRQYASLFERFVEAHTNDMVDMVMDVQVWDGIALESNLPNAAMIERYQPNSKYDSCIITADYTSVVEGGLMGVNGGFYSYILWRSSWDAGQTIADYENDEHQIARIWIHIHEWCHQLAGYFPWIDSNFRMPGVHDLQDNMSGYTEENTGSDGWGELSQAYFADFLQGTMRKFPGASWDYRPGIHPNWWQFHPLYLKSGITTNPSNYATNVSRTPSFTVNYTDAVYTTNDGRLTFSIFSVIGAPTEGESVEQLDGYWLPSAGAVRSDGKTLTVNWENVQRYDGTNDVPAPPLDANKKYRVAWWNVKYVDEQIKYRSPDFEITFTTGG
jgi:hypothetical protein